MHTLIIGGTIFLGRHIVADALNRGHTITLFHRGRHNPELFPEVERIIGDRDGGLAPLRGRSFDAVIDTCGYVPRVVDQSARLLSGAAPVYVFLSSISAYADFRHHGVAEDDPTGQLADPSVEKVDGETYGPLKAACERRVQETWAEGALTVRPGLIVGPQDPTDRFTYWPVRIAEGGEVLAPESPARATQIIDARDLASWILDMAEAGRGGVYNATGPRDVLTLGELFETCRRAGGSDATFTWVTPGFLAAEGVAPWSEVPLWVPSEPDSIGFDSVSIVRALAAGLRFRPLEETVRDTLSWARSRPQPHSWRAGLTRERERELLRKWR